MQTNPDTGHMQLLNVQIEVTSRTLKLLGVDDTMLNAKGEVAVLQVLYILPYIPLLNQLNSCNETIFCAGATMQILFFA